MVADETPAVHAVLRADTKRLRLLDEEKRLQALLDGGDDAAAERLETNEIKNIKEKKKWKMHLMMNKYLVLKMPLNQHAAAITFVSDTD